MLDVLAKVCVCLNRIHKHKQAARHNSKPESRRGGICVAFVCPSDHLYIYRPWNPGRDTHPHGVQPAGAQKTTGKKKAVIDACGHEGTNETKSKLIRDGSWMLRRLRKHKEYVRGLTRKQQPPLITIAGCHTVYNLLVGSVFTIEQRRVNNDFHGREINNVLLALKAVPWFSVRGRSRRIPASRHFVLKLQRTPSVSKLKPKCHCVPFWSSEGWFHYKKQHVYALKWLAACLNTVVPLYSVEFEFMMSYETKAFQ